MEKPNLALEIPDYLRFWGVLFFVENVFFFGPKSTFLVVLLLFYSFLDSNCVQGLDLIKSRR